MNKSAMKKLINEEFGFATNKIILLEASTDKNGKYDYIMFEVCGIEYQMKWYPVEQVYRISVYESHYRYEPYGRF